MTKRRLVSGFLTMPMAAARLGVSLRRVQAMVQAGLLPVILMPTGGYLTNEPTVEALLQNRKGYRWRAVEWCWPAARPPKAEEETELAAGDFEPDDLVDQLYAHIGESLRRIDPKLMNRSTRDDILNSGAQFAQAIYRARRVKPLAASFTV